VNHVLYMLEEPPKALDTCAASAEELTSVLGASYEAEAITRTLSVLGFIACIQLVIAGEARGNSYTCTDDIV